MRSVRRETPRFRGKLVERGRTAHQLLENPDFARYKEVFCRHEAIAIRIIGSGTISAIHASLSF